MVSSASIHGMETENRIETEYLARIRELMARRHMNQKQLAEAVGVVPHTIGRILKAEVALKVPLAIRICETLGTTAGKLLADSISAARRGEEDGSGSE